MTPAARLIWVKTYERTGDAGVACRRCGVSRPTLRKWWRRYKEEGEAGLIDRSRRPLNSPGRRVLAPVEQLIIKLRKGRKLGIKRLRIELQRLHGIRLAIDTIHKVLCRHGLNRLKRPRLVRKRWKRYARPIPGERVQMDVCKIRSGLYQYTAIDDCSRYQVVGIFPNKSATSTLAFLDQVVEEMPVSIQRIQTDRGQEFFAYKVQDRLRQWTIKFRPIRPRAPHLNGKVERVQRTALEEFWPTVDLDDPELEMKLAEWQHFYNWERPHDGLGGDVPIDRLCDRIHQAPLGEEIAATYDVERELILPRDFWRAPNRRPE
jgi:transposase InsO family protein